MRSLTAVSLTALLSLSALPALGAGGFGDVDIDVVTPNGRAFPLHEHIETRFAGGRRADDAMRAWVEAVPGAPYAIRVRNTTGQRIGLVIAVDGRNIVNGRPSNLARTEAMYVLGPWQTGVYEGWRTGRNRVNEFYFTEAQRSYAGAFDDFSAMGLISVATFREHVPPQRRYKGLALPQGNVRPQGGAGTGFGDERHSPSRRVEFEAARRASSVTLLRYEWRETLCELGVVACRNRWDSGNRLWDRHYRTTPGMFAPPPPRQPRRPWDWNAGRDYWRR